MIVYTKAGTELLAQTYSIAYPSEQQHFSHEQTFRALDQFLARSEAPLRSCLDIGCGQGDILAYIAENAQREAGHFDGRRFVGLDMDDAAIDRCEASRPDLGWIVDAYQDFAETGGFERCFPGGVDLIVNNGGFATVYSEKDYVDAMLQTKSHLSENGRFFFATTRTFYQKWAGSRAASWKRDPLQIVFDVFGEPEVLPNASHHFFLFSNIPQPHAPYARSIAFAFDDGSETEAEIFFDFPMRLRAAASLADTPAVKTVVQEFHLAVGPEMETSVTRKLNPDDPGIRWVESVRNCNLYRRGLHGLASAPAEKIVFGGSSRDWLVNARTGHPAIDLDEFHATFDWLFSRLKASGCPNIVYMTAFPRLEGAEKSGLIYSPAAAEPFRNVLHRLSQQHDIDFRDLTDVGSDAASRKEWAATVIAAVKEAIR